LISVTTWIRKNTHNKRGSSLDKEELKDLVKLSITGINALRTMHYSNPEFKSWIKRVKELLVKAYGEDSAEYRRFINAPGKFFVVRTETGMTEEYLRKLDCYENALNSLISEE
jgi:hypothetical protein